MKVVLMLLPVLLTFSLTVLSLASHSEELHGSLYFKKPPTPARAKELLYKFSAQIKSKGGKTVRKGQFTDPKGKVVVKENVSYLNGRIKKYLINHLQLKEKWLISVKNGKVHYTVEKNGKRTTKTEDYKDNFVVGASIMPYLQDKWADLTSGKKIKVRIGVANRQESFGFKILKDGETTIGGAKVIIAKINPSNFIVRQLTDPIYFYIRLKDRQLVQVVGRTIPKIKEGGEWKDLDVKALYTFKK